MYPRGGDPWRLSSTHRVRGYQHPNSQRFPHIFRLDHVLALLFIIQHDDVAACPCADLLDHINCKRSEYDSSKEQFLVHQSSCRVSCQSLSQMHQCCDFGITYQQSVVQHQNWNAYSRVHINKRAPEALMVHIREPGSEVSKYSVVTHHRKIY